MGGANRLNADNTNLDPHEDKYLSRPADFFALAACRRWDPHFWRVKNPHPSRTCTVLMPGLRLVRPASEMCM